MSLAQTSPHSTESYFCSTELTPHQLQKRLLVRFACFPSGTFLIAFLFPSENPSWYKFDFCCWGRAGSASGRGWQAQVPHEGRPRCDLNSRRCQRKITHKVGRLMILSSKTLAKNSACGRACKHPRPLRPLVLHLDDSCCRGRLPLGLPLLLNLAICLILYLAQHPMTSIC